MRNLRSNDCGCIDSHDFDAELAFRRVARQNSDLASTLSSYLAGGGNPLNRLSGAVALEEAVMERLTRIVGGVETDAGEYRECCLVGRTNANGTESWFCTGVLVHPKVVLTAAHCATPSLAPSAVAMSATRMSDLGAADVKEVRRFVPHPSYAVTGQHDIAVLILRQPSHTPPVRIASTEAIVAANKLTLVGFGNNDLSSTRGFGVQRKVVVNVLSVRRNGAEDLDADEAVFGFESDFELVAGGSGFDSCNGDSGGPAYIADPQGRTVAALTSRGIRGAVNACGEGGIYVRIDQHRDFIARVMEANGLDPREL